MIPTLLTKIILGINYFSLIYVILISTIYLIQLICAAIGLRKYVPVFLQKQPCIMVQRILSLCVFHLFYHLLSTSGSNLNSKRNSSWLSPHKITSKALNSTTSPEI